MAENRRVNVRALLADPDLRLKLMVSTIQATQAREGIETTEEQARRAYYVVNEVERATFFALEPHRGAKDKEDRRHDVFVQALRNEFAGVRYNVPRRDFLSIDGAPLAYQRVGLVAHLFRQFPALDPAIATCKQGLATSDDNRWLREFWEVNASDIGQGKKWVRFAKGGDYCRFYYDHDLVIKWADDGRELKAFIVAKDGSETKRIYSQEWYFRQGLTWPRRTAKGLNVRRLMEGSIFADKGPALFITDRGLEHYVLGVTNSHMFEYLFRTKTSFSWEVGIMKSMPIPRPTPSQLEQVGTLADAIFYAKAQWDNGNEISTGFRSPWILFLHGEGQPSTLPDRLTELMEREQAEQLRIQEYFVSLNEAIYRLYDIPDHSRALIERGLGERPAEIIWPQMEGKTPDQKRMEHVWRLLSYAVKRVVEADEDGVVPFLQAVGKSSLLDRIRAELGGLFPGRDVNELEVEIVNELKRKVKGYDRAESIQEWLENIYFTYHTSLYKNRPIFWHISSKQGKARAAFSALVHYHRFDKDRMAKLRGVYLREAIGVFRREAALAGQAGRTDDRLEWQAKVEETEELDRRLQRVQEGFHQGGEDFRILTPWKAERERPTGWDPDINDGVKVNIEPLQRAGVLRISEVV